jgi:DNA-binding GntR family transcriptional regulator
LDGARPGRYAARDGGAAIVTVRTVLRDGPSDSTPTAAERAYQEVRQRILDGRLPAGRRLKELDLARELGISRTPVRDALSRLNVEGLLDFRPNLGATVAVWSETQIEQMFRIRAMLEPFAAEIAARQIGEEEIVELRTLCGIMEEAARRETSADLMKLAAANARFHRIILEAARSEHLAKLIAMAMDAPLTLRIFSRYTAEEIERSMRHHREVVDALSHHDPSWAESAMRTHIVSGGVAARKSSRADGKAAPSPTAGADQRGNARRKGQRRPGAQAAQ